MILNLYAVLVIFILRSQAHEPSSQEDKLEEFFEEVKPISESIQDVNVTNSGNQEQKEMYDQWSKWSSCRNCRKVRRKVCVSIQCNYSILYEERACNTPRCRRRLRDKSKGATRIMKIETRRFEDDSLYSRWSEWSTCSEQCTTRRHRFCITPGTCEQNPDVQMAYCYKEQTACHQWILSMLNRKQSNSNRKYAYDVTTTNKKNRKVKQKKPRKCGIAYRTKHNNNHSNMYSMMKIMGGKISKPGKWPWHVALLNYRKEVFCGGTLISPNWILTAAHCLRKILYVRLNEYDISFEDGSEIEYQIREMYPHYNYDTRTVDNDIALLKLPKSVPLPYACLPSNTSLPSNKNCTIVGWGKRSPYDFLGSKYLREAQMPVASKETCKKAYRRYVITENMFCAGYRSGGIDTCSGDSGGGFMCLPKGKRYGWTVQGITSFGESCGKKGKYGIYTDVRKYLPWLKRKIKQV